MDLIGPLPRTDNQKRYIICAVDYGTRYAITDSLKEIKADDVAKFFIEKIVANVGCPRRVLTDQGRQFISSGLNKVFDYFNTTHSLCSKYHPQTSGLTERTNRTLLDSISMYCNTNQKNWSKVLPFIQLAHNSSRSISTGISPFFAMYGVEATLPIDLNLRLDLKVDYDLQILSNRWTEARDLLKQNLKGFTNNSKTNLRQKTPRD